jgi:hypothetical protein
MEKTPQSEYNRGIPWALIQDTATKEALDVHEISERFGVKVPTIRQQIQRGKLVLVSKAITALQRRVTEKAIEKAVSKKADEWLERGERHRKVAFDLAHDSLKLMRPKAPRNFREAESADKIARRAAGLDTADTVQQTLININEAMSSEDEPQPVRATVVSNEDFQPTASDTAVEDALLT